jgi:hypothetical protein
VAGRSAEVVARGEKRRPAESVARARFAGKRAFIRRFADRIGARQQNRAGHFAHSQRHHPQRQHRERARAGDCDHRAAPAQPADDQRRAAIGADHREARFAQLGGGPDREAAGSDDGNRHAVRGQPPTQRGAIGEEGPGSAQRGPRIAGRRPPGKALDQHDFAAPAPAHRLADRGRRPHGAGDVTLDEVPVDRSGPWTGVDYQGIDRVAAIKGSEIIEKRRLARPLKAENLDQGAALPAILGGVLERLGVLADQAQSDPGPGIRPRQRDPDRVRRADLRQVRHDHGL